MSKRSKEPDLEELLARARRSRARKQHLVPAFYLRNWKDERGLLRVTDKELGIDYLKKPEKVARVTDFYTLDSDQLDSEEMPPLLAETVFAEVESRAAPVIARLVNDSHPSLQPEDLESLAWFLAFQFTRGRAIRREQMESATSLYKLQFGEMTDEMLREYLGQDGEPIDESTFQDARGAIEDLMSGEVVVGPDRSGSVAYTMASAEELGSHLVARAWMICDSPTPLITCDEPIVLLGASDRPRGERAGVATSEVVAFPISPYRILMMIHPVVAFESGLEPVAVRGRLVKDELDLVEALQLSREMAMNCHRWTFELSSRRIGSWMWIPESVSAMGSEWIEVTDATDRTADVHRGYATTRWQSIPPDLWPVGRWWPDRAVPYPRVRQYSYRGSLDDVGPDGQAYSGVPEFRRARVHSG